MNPRSAALALGSFVLMACGTSADSADAGDRLMDAPGNAAADARPADDAENAADSGATDVGAHDVRESSDAGMPPVIRRVSYQACVAALDAQGSGWCEIRLSDEHPSMSSVWPQDLDRRVRMNVGPAAVLVAWNSAAYDREGRRLYFMGGGHNDYGGNEVYEFDIMASHWTRLSDPSPLDHLFVSSDYGTREDKPWRRLCWMPDFRQVPGSSHTYDGLLFHSGTRTLFFDTYGAATGSCFEDEEDEYRGSPLVSPFIEGRNGRWESSGYYEFNPSPVETRNGLAPVTWRRVFDYETFRAAGAEGGYPRSVELPDGRIAVGTRVQLFAYDPLVPDPSTLTLFSGLADRGDGLVAYDPVRFKLWSIHRRGLLEYDAATGETEQVYDFRDREEVDHGKSLAFDEDGHIVSWNGSSTIWMLDPTSAPLNWRRLDWGDHGPLEGDGRVYGKWVHVENDTFVGISTHHTGVWVYRHPR